MLRRHHCVRLGARGGHSGDASVVPPEEARREARGGDLSRGRCGAIRDGVRQRASEFLLLLVLLVSFISAVGVGSS